MMKKPWVLVPGRAGSKGIKDKNTQLVGGVPLIRRSVEHALRLDSEFPIVVSSDSLDYLALAIGKELGQTDIEVLEGTGVLRQARIILHLRPTKLGKDTALIMDLVAELALNNEFLSDLNLGNCLLLQPTTPFRHADELDDFGTKLRFSGEDASVVSVVDAVDDHPARMYLPNVESGTLFGSALSDFEHCQFMPRQALPQAFIRDGGYYIIGSNLIERREQVGARPELYVRKYPFSINIDSQDDLDLATIATSRRELLSKGLT